MEYRNFKKDFIQELENNEYFKSVFNKDFKIEKCVYKEASDNSWDFYKILIATQNNFKYFLKIMNPVSPSDESFLMQYINEEEISIFPYVKINHTFKKFELPSNLKNYI